MPSFLVIDLTSIRQQFYSLTPSLYKFLQCLRPVDALLYSVSTVFLALYLSVIYFILFYVLVIWKNYGKYGFIQ